MRHQAGTTSLSKGDVRCRSEPHLAFSDDVRAVGAGAVLAALSFVDWDHGGPVRSDPHRRRWATTTLVVLVMAVVAVVAGAVAASARAGGAYRLHAWIYADRTRAAPFYEQQRKNLIGLARVVEGPSGDLRGFGQRAYEAYDPVTVSNDPLVRIQPGRRLDLVLIDANLVLTVSMSTRRPMGTHFPDSDQHYRDVVHRAVLGTVAKLRAGRPPG
jgi:hypothetical protein